MNNSNENHVQERCLFRRAAKPVALLALTLAIVVSPIAWHMLAGLFDVTNQCSTSATGIVWSISAVANHVLLSAILAIACTEAAAFAALGVVQLLILYAQYKYKAKLALHVLLDLLIITAGTLGFPKIIIPHMVPAYNNSAIVILEVVVIIAYFAGFGCVLAITDTYLRKRYVPCSNDDNVKNRDNGLENTYKKLEAKRQLLRVREVQEAIHRIKPITLDAKADPARDNCHRKQLFLDKVLVFEFVNRGLIWFMLSCVAGALPVVFSSTTCLKPGASTVVIGISAFLYAGGIVGVLLILLQKFVFFPSYVRMLKRRDSCCTGSDIEYWNFHYEGNTSYVEKARTATDKLGIEDNVIRDLCIGEKRKIYFCSKYLIGSERFAYSYILVHWDCKNTLTVTCREDLLADIQGLSNKQIILAKAHCSNNVVDAARTASELIKNFVKAVDSGYFSVHGYSGIAIVTPTGASSDSEDEDPEDEDEDLTEDECSDEL